MELKFTAYFMNRKTFQGNFLSGYEIVYINSGKDELKIVEVDLYTKYNNFCYLFRNK